jgi:hypothetical protein
MYFFQESTPDTSAYMIAGYAVVFTVTAIYLASLVIRWRNLDQDLHTLENIQAESRPRAEAPKKPAPKKTARKTTGKKPVPRKK